MTTRKLMRSWFEGILRQQKCKIYDITEKVLTIFKMDFKRESPTGQIKAARISTTNIIKFVLWFF